MRYDVKKFLFAGVEEEKDAFFKKAQEAGVINFIDSNSSRAKVFPDEVRQISKAIKILRGLPPAEQEETDEYEIADGIAQKIISLKNKSEKLSEEERVLKLDISRVEAFGTFSKDDIESLEQKGKRKVQFYFAKQGVLNEEEIPEDVIYVGSDHGLDYFVGINKKTTQYPKMVEMQIDHSWGELKKQYKELIEQTHETERSLKKYAKYNRFLHHALVQKLNNFHLEDAKNLVQFPMDDSLYVVEGWVPVHKIDELHKLVDSMNVHVEEIALDEKDKIPTYLENTGAGKIGEDLIKIYDTPSNTDKDPSLWVLVFFSLFFAMIIGDGGYGLLFLMGALYIRYKHSGMTGVKKRILNLFTMISFAIIAWGVLTTSFFGITIPPNSTIRSFSLMEWLVEKKITYDIKHKTSAYEDMIKKYPQVKGMTNPTEILSSATTVHHEKLSYELLNKLSDNIMMELALFVGVVHVLISLIRNLNRTPAGLGWIIFLIGCYLVVPEFLGASSLIHYAFGIEKEAAASNGMYLIYGGIGIATIIAIYQHKWAGIVEPMTVIQVFADVLSYLRLYALGLSGALLTLTLNELAASVNVVFGALIIIFGYLTNMVLGVMSGVIHGLRLNFLEWYHYSFEGGGKMFNPLRKIEIE